jgi:hypothetical protein
MGYKPGQERGGANSEHPMRPFARAALAAFLALAAASPAIADDNLRTSAQPLATGTLNNVLVFDLSRNEAVMGVNVAGLTASGATLTIEGSSDAKGDSDSTKVWVAIVGVPFTCPSPTVFTTMTADQSFKVDTSGLTNVRFRVSSVGSGSATIGLNAIPGAAMGVCGGGGGGTVTQGSQGSASSAWFDQPVQGGSVVGAANGLYVQPATGAAWNLGTIGGAATAANQATELTYLSTIAGSSNTAIPGGTNNIGSVNEQIAGVNVSTAAGFSSSATTRVIAAVDSPDAAFVQGGAFASLTATTSSGNRVALPAGATVEVTNTGANAAWALFGSSSVTASATAGDLIQPGFTWCYGVGSSSYLSAITAAGTTTLSISGGSGMCSGVPVAGGSSKPVGPASIATSQASISTSAATIVAARTGVTGIGRVSVTLYNSGSTVVYFGASGVTTATGQVLIAGASVTLDTTAAIYGITASGTDVVSVTETY